MQRITWQDPRDGIVWDVTAKPDDGIRTNIMFSRGVDRYPTVADVEVTLDPDDHEMLQSWLDAARG